MAKYGIPPEVLDRLHTTHGKCAYCWKIMIHPFNPLMRKESSTIEHLNLEGPFYWSLGLEERDITICCSSCNSSRGTKDLKSWFESKYCVSKGISIISVHERVRAYIERRYDKNGNYIRLLETHKKEKT